MAEGAGKIPLGADGGVFLVYPDKIEGVGQRVGSQSPSKGYTSQRLRAIRRLYR